MIRVYTNADVMTMNPEQPKADIFGTFKDRFLGVGSDQFLKTIPGNMVEHIDLQGKTVIPRRVSESMTQRASQLRYRAQG
jgi:predicted amidohydrolase YtcJ